MAEAVRLQGVNNATSLHEAAIPLASFEGLVLPLLRLFRAPTTGNLFGTAFKQLHDVAIARLSRHPQPRLVVSLSNAVTKHIDSHLKPEQPFNVGTMMRTWWYVKALLWIATDHCNECIPLLKSVIKLELGAVSAGGSVMTLIMENS